MCTLTWLLARRRSPVAAWIEAAVAASSQNAWIEMRGIGRALWAAASGAGSAAGTSSRLPCETSSSTTEKVCLLMSTSLLVGAGGQLSAGRCPALDGLILGPRRPRHLALAILVEHHGAALLIGR